MDTTPAQSGSGRTRATRKARAFRLIAVLALGLAPLGGRTGNRDRPAAEAAPGAAAPISGEVHLELAGALWHVAKPDQPATLMLRLECRQGRWDPVVWGECRRYNHGDHLGRIVEVSRDGSETRLAIRMRIESDPWTAGALAEYAIAFKQVGGRFEGAWKGMFRGEECEGEVGGSVAPTRPQVKDFVPPEPGEHPRLLVRKSDVPALRDKARTEWGRKALERLKGGDGSKSNMAVGRGLLYVLTGERAYAEEARRLLEADIDAGRWYSVSLVHEPAVKAVEAAVAFDLIWNAADPAFRAKMNALFAEKAPYLYNGADAGGFNPNDGSNWSAMYRAGTGMCALSLLGEPGPYPPRPKAPGIPRLAAPADLTIGKDVPVVKLEGGKKWSTWLFAGPFKVAEGQDALASIGGAANARPEHGTKVTLRVRVEQEEGAAGQTEPVERVFAPLDPKHLVTRELAQRYQDPVLEGAVDMTAVTGNAYLTTSSLYAVVENDRPGFFKIRTATKKLRNPCVYIAGRRLENGDCVHLGKGRFPVLASVPISWVGNWVKIPFYLRLEPLAEDRAAAWLKTQRAEYEYDLAAWEAGLQAYRRGGKSHPHAERWLGAARQRIENWAIKALGDHGWNTEGQAYTQHSYRLVLPFAHCYRNATGKELVARPNLRMALPLYTARTIFGRQGARMQGYGPGGGSLGVDNYARGFALVPENLMPAVLWSWNRTFALAEAGKFTDPHGVVGHLDPMSAAFMFVNYPLDVKERNPSRILSRVVVDRQRGGYVFRNRWEDEDDFVATIHLNSHMYGGGWAMPDAADFRISGLGVDWTVRGTGWGNGASWRRFPHRRIYQNVLQLAEPVSQGSREALTTFFEACADGSGVVAMNMDHVYGGDEPGPKGDARLPPVRPGWKGGAAYDLGIRGMRSFAVDYSGAAEAPCLVAVADRVTGTRGENTWQLCTDQAHTVTVGDNAFTITADNGATLRGTIAAPASATIETQEVTTRHEINYHGRHSHRDFQRTVINVRGGEFFLVVMTVQKGRAPEVTVEGEGLNAVATVGKRRAWFDGEKIILGE